MAKTKRPLIVQLDDGKHTFIDDERGLRYFDAEDSATEVYFDGHRGIQRLMQEVASLRAVNARLTKQEQGVGAALRVAQEAIRGVGSASYPDQLAHARYTIDAMVRALTLTEQGYEEWLEERREWFSSHFDTWDAGKQLPPRTYR